MPINIAGPGGGSQGPPDLIVVGSGSYACPAGRYAVVIDTSTITASNASGSRLANNGIILSSPLDVKAQVVLTAGQVLSRTITGTSKSGTHAGLNVLTDLYYLPYIFWRIDGSNAQGQGMGQYTQQIRHTDSGTDSYATSLSLTHAFTALEYII